MDDKIIAELTQFATSIKDFINDGRAKGSFLPEEQEYQQWKLDNFEYIDSGVKSSGAQGKTLIRKTWLRARISVEKYFCDSKECKELQETLKNTFPEFHLDYLYRFIGKVVDQCFNENELNSRTVENIIGIFIKDLKQEPVKCDAEVELAGIVLKNKMIKIRGGIIIRQTEITDLEKEISLRFEMKRFREYPSAILLMESYDRNPNDLQRKMVKAITILRLFKPGSIRYLTCKLSSESIAGLMGGTLYPGGDNHVLDTCLIQENEVEKLKKFWGGIENHIPDSLTGHDGGKTDYHHIAYNRYEDSLMKNGTIERRIANAIMGLEGIFLRGGEIQELSYRLSFRVARLMSIFGIEPMELRKAISDSYQVRNQFVHGGLLSYDKKNELEEKYGELKNLLFKVLDSLRISIVNSLMINVSKDELIDIIDKSFIDDGHWEKLKTITSQSRDVLI